jgi:hypothetical protein
VTISKDAEADTTADGDYAGVVKKTLALEKIIKLETDSIK